MGEDLAGLVDGSPGASGVVIAEIEPPRAVVRLVGEVDLGVAAELHRLAQDIAARQLPVLLDAENLSFTDRVSCEASGPPTRRGDEGAA